MSKKSKSPSSVADGSDSGPPEAAYAAFFQQEIANASKLMGRSNVLVAHEATARRYGVELPSLALQQVVTSNVLFMETIMLIAGKPASHKSSFAFEMSRWAIMQGGYARVYETEGNKVSPTLPIQLIGESLINEQTWQVLTCDSINVWQEAFSDHIRHYREFFRVGRKLKAGEKRLPLMPACHIIDSLTGRSTEANIEAFEKDGESANTQGARNAKAINDFLQNVSLIGLPFYVVIIRHEKDGSLGQPAFSAAGTARSTPGGKAPDFMGGYDLRFTVVESHREQDGGFNTVRITCRKNAFGVDRGRCDVRFSWRWMDVAGERVQVPKWEWDLSTAQLLANYDSREVRDICDVSAVERSSKMEPRFSSKKLGLVNVTGQEIGAAVRLDADLMKQLQDFMHISRWPAFTPTLESSE